MCTTCGCGQPEGPSHHHADQKLVAVEQAILAKNDAYAADNRRRLQERGIFTLNLLSSPGAGKTTLLIRTIEALAGDVPVSVIEGDQRTSRDAERIRKTGSAAVQINTGRGCHLDAHGVGHALTELDPAAQSILAIENVGNLVCPAAFDLGETARVVILSVTEGDDKPLKYPDVFYAADLLVLSKVDLLPHVEFDPHQSVTFARRIRPDLETLSLSATTGEGMPAWLEWLRRGHGRVVAGLETGPNP